MPPFFSLETFDPIGDEDRITPELLEQRMEDSDDEGERLFGR